ncbi:doublesex and mab-3 related transcription factor 3, truncated-like isoform X2 [Cimex lectularius]|uniref:DM domain-containing protein n=1 Tax=Cimex lectularius TaxID=79782 RepID=A0A8I6RWB3_CIMLE|nr:doublesex and mab-3 related transcription factor 3, truncated-like isoform X2 [Cimex lectularius]
MIKTVLDANTERIMESEEKDHSTAANDEDNSSSNKSSTRKRKNKIVYCKLCRNHKIFSEVKEHKDYCHYKYCDCINCLHTKQERKRFAKRTRERRAEKLAKQRAEKNLPAIPVMKPNTSDRQLSIPSPSSSSGTNPNPDSAPNSPIAMSTISRIATINIPYLNQNAATLFKIF